ncbi:MAG: hypothetical protein KJ607_12510, partial [Bacteroidetes bacterium]|nr:hypothetical protein [Bacteroidota bacterium]
VNNRIQGDWKIEDYSVDGIDYTQLIIDSLGDIVFFYVYDPGDGVGSNEIRFTAIPSVLTGVWFFNDNKREISIRFNDTHDSLFYENLELFVESQKSIWDIRKLSKKEFRIETTFENKDYKLILKR